MGRRETGRNAGKKSLSLRREHVAGVMTVPLSFKCFIAGWEFESRMRDEH